MIVCYFRRIMIILYAFLTDLKLDMNMHFILQIRKGLKHINQDWIILKSLLLRKQIILALLMRLLIKMNLMKR